MNRVWDYIGFVIWFAGLGYIVMWLVGSTDHLTLPPGLHTLGVAAAMLVPVRLVLCAVRRRRAAASYMPVVRARNPASVLRPVRRKPQRPLRTVKPRNHFGLRGMPE
jgi:hypothetical protein